MCVARSRRRARALGATHHAEGMTREELRAEARAEMPPRAHVVRLVLHPHRGDPGTETLERFGNERGRQRIELLEAHDRDVFPSELFATRSELVINLTAAEQDLGDRGGIDLGIGDHALEASLRAIFEARNAFRMAEQ